MRRIRRTRDGRWYTAVDDGDVTRLEPPRWQPDDRGRWPRVDLEVRSLGETVACPHCGSAWTFEEMDCVFGRSRRDGNDVLVLARCVSCRLPHRVRAVGLVTAYPRVVELMEGWTSWEHRRAQFEAEEVRLYGEGS